MRAIRLISLGEPLRDAEVADPVPGPGDVVVEVRAAGISVLSEKVDIANVRLQFANGCVANLTASRVSTERVRKLRLFQPGQYVSIDYARQECVVIGVDGNRQFGVHPQQVEKREPLAVQFDAFLDCVETRSTPDVDGVAAARALEAARMIANPPTNSRVSAKGPSVTVN